MLTFNQLLEEKKKELNDGIQSPTGELVLSDEDCATITESLSHIDTAPAYSILLDLFKSYSFEVTASKLFAKKSIVYSFKDTSQNLNAKEQKIKVDFVSKKINEDDYNKLYKTAKAPTLSLSKNKYYSLIKELLAVSSDYKQTNDSRGSITLIDESINRGTNVVSITYLVKVYSNDSGEYINGYTIQLTATVK